MTRKIELLYDDSSPVNSVIETVVGQRYYGEILYQKKRLFEMVQHAAQESQINCRRIRDEGDFVQVAHELAIELADQQTSVIYHQANAAITDYQAYVHLLKKASYAKSNFTNSYQSPYFAVFSDHDSWQEFSKAISEQTKKIINANLIDVDYALTDVSDSSKLLSLLSGHLEARHFNSMFGDEHILVKSSQDKKKILSEYRYYSLLPESLRYWFVAPFNFREDNDTSSYQMERLHITNVAMSWLHEAFNEASFKRFLARVFRFIKERPIRNASHNKGTRELYFEKVQTRYDSLKQHPHFLRLDHLVRTGVNSNGVDGVMQRYFGLADKILDLSQNTSEAISHGDLCFSNILYDKQTNHLRLIDPKGAIQEEDLWLESYYDIAKLSHSVLGNYDLICHDQFSLTVETDLKLSLNINSRNLNPLKEVFIETVRDAGFNPIRMRLCEVSLFLSMLFLHSDNFKRVLALLLNADLIMNELEVNLGVKR